MDKENFQTLYISVPDEAEVIFENVIKMDLLFYLVL